MPSLPSVDDSSLAEPNESIASMAARSLLTSGVGLFGSITVEIFAEGDLRGGDEVCDFSSSDTVRGKGYCERVGTGRVMGGAWPMTAGK